MQKFSTLGFIYTMRALETGRELSEWNIVFENIHHTGKFHI